MKKLLILAIVLIATGAAVFAAVPQKDPAETATVSTGENPSDGTTGEEAGLPTYSMGEVARHTSEADCWTVINGSVYNLTSYIPRHEGGDEILQACGKDGTSLFTERRTEDGESVGSGTPHSSQALNALAQLKIGELTE